MNKKILVLIIILIVIGALVCSFFIIKNKNNNSNNNESNINIDENTNKGKDSLVINKSVVLYFSVTGNTKTVAESIKNNTGSDIIEIVPKVKYTDSDLDYGNEKTRATVEQKDTSSRPEIENNIDLSKYDTIFLGYPIWWGDAPKIILTLLDKYNLENKKLILFCTSGSSGIEESVKTIKKYNNKLNILNSSRFSEDANSKEVEFWIDSLNIKKEDKSITVSINDKDLPLVLEDNSAVDELLKKLESGNITIKAHDYANFEKVGNLGFSLPTNDSQMDVSSGDIVLYEGDKISLLYDTNNWSYTKIGKIKDISNKKLKKLLGKGDVNITFKLND